MVDTIDGHERRRGWAEYFRALWGCYPRVGRSPRSPLPAKRGEGGVRGTLTQFQGDRFQNSFDFAHDLVIPESQHSIAPFFQIFRTAFVVFVKFHVLRAVQFHDQAPLQTTKVDDEWTDRMLAAEF